MSTNFSSESVFVEEWKKSVRIARSVSLHTAVCKETSFRRLQNSSEFSGHRLLRQPWGNSPESQILTDQPDRFVNKYRENTTVANIKRTEMEYFIQRKCARISYVSSYFMPICGNMTAIFMSDITCGLIWGFRGGDVSSRGLLSCDVL